MLLILVGDIVRIKNDKYETVTDDLLLYINNKLSNVTHIKFNTIKKALLNISNFIIENK